MWETGLWNKRKSRVRLPLRPEEGFFHVHYWTPFHVITGLFNLLRYFGAVKYSGLKFFESEVIAPLSCCLPPPPVLHILLFYTRHIFNFPSSHPVLRIRIRYPVPFWPLDPGSGVFFSGSRITDLGSRIPNHIFESLVTISGVKSSIVLRKLAQIFFFSISKIK